MRKIIVILLILMLCGAALAETPPGNRLGYKVLLQLSEGKQNAFISPVSLAWALSMAAEGATGETRQKLLSALDADDTAQLSELGGALGEAGLVWANAAFVGQGIALLPDYESALTANYDAELFPLDGTVDADAWVREKTGGLIDSLPLDTSGETQLMLVNAAALEAEWASPFDPSDTWAADFHAPDGDVTVDFMHQTAYVQYGESMGCQLMCKGYMNGRLVMYIALPPEGGLKRALTNLAENPNSFFTFKPNPQEVFLSLPKLDMATGGSLKDAIVAAGCWLPFSEQYADYSGISDVDLLISDVHQQVRVQVDEEGTRAAAETDLPMAMSAPFMDEDIVDFICDRPFILALMDRTTGTALFVGAVVNPAEGK